MGYKTSIFIVLLIIGVIGAVLADMWLQKDKQENNVKKSDCVNFNESLENASETYNVLLKSRTFMPPEGIECSLLNNLKPTDRIHVMVQFRNIPSEQQRKELQSNDVYLGSYLHGMAFFASIPSSEVRLREVKNLSYVRWIGDILPDDKLNDDVRKNQIGSWAIDEKGNILLQIMFHNDISQEQMGFVVNKYGTINGEIVSSINLAVASVPKEKILQLAGEDAVSWIEPVPPPPTIDRQSD